MSCLVLKNASNSPKSNTKFSIANKKFKFSKLLSCINFNGKVKNDKKISIIENIKNSNTIENEIEYCKIYYDELKSDDEYSCLVYNDDDYHEGEVFIEEFTYESRGTVFWFN
jgi:hypothetical protein